MATQPSELALRELLAVSIGTVSAYATLDPFLTDARELATVLEEIGYGELAKGLLAGCAAAAQALQAVAQLAVPPPKMPALVPADERPAWTKYLDGVRPRYPQPGTSQAIQTPDWSGAPQAQAGFTHPPASESPVVWPNLPSWIRDTEGGS